MNSQAAEPVQSIALAAVQAEAAQTVAHVLGGMNLDAALQKARTPDWPSGSRSALRDLATEALRRWGLWSTLVQHLNKNRTAQPALAALIAVALHQLKSERIAAHAIVAQAVDAAALLGHAGAKGWVNALLRTALREGAALEAKLISDSEVARWNHPQWWIDQVRRDWPAHWEAILAAGNEKPPMSLRVNRTKSTQADYLQQLRALGIEARAVGKVGIVLAKPIPVIQLPQWREGFVAVQDTAAQLAAPLLDLANGQRILDACAAPGGKAAHCLESAAELHLTALDSDGQRLSRFVPELSRLGLNAKPVVGDARTPKAWWDGKPFDRILLDAPCTGSGVVRRHPDGKWLKRESDIASLARLQAEMLDALWPTLAVGGKLLYVTCSVHRAENADQIAAFLARTADATRANLQLPGQCIDEAGAQLLPAGRATTHNHDGLYFALLHKA